MTDAWSSQEALPSWPREHKGEVEALPKMFRPREKLFARGAAALGKAELVALVLGSGHTKSSAVATADLLIRRHGLKGLKALTPQQWTKEPGVGNALAARLSAAFELGRRAASGEAEERPKVTRPREVWALTRELARAKKEHLVGLYLDAHNGLIHKETISIGSLNTTRTHPREILYPAIVHLALGFILVHNHPSGSVDPSDEDVVFTRAVQRAGEIVGIELYDHLIVAGSGFASLKERGAF